MSQNELTSVAVYPRVIKASLARIWENVLDWEHLPWLHREAFSSIESLAADATGWRARIGLVGGSEVIVEIVVDRARNSYVTRTVAGEGNGTEIWTRLDPLDDSSTRIVVEFLLPDVGATRRDAIGAAYVALYRRLWDEDEVMMQRRELLLSRGDACRQPKNEARTENVSLGQLGELRSRLPLCVAVGRRKFRVVEVDGTLIAHSTECPHRLGPLEDVAIEDGSIRCPWHGYRFDVRTGEGRDGLDLALERAPEVKVDPATTNVWLVPA